MTIGELDRRAERPIWRVTSPRVTRPATSRRPDKLLIKPDTTLWCSHSEHFELLEPIPPGARVVDRLEQATVALLFAEDASSLGKAVAAHRDNLRTPGTL